MQLKAISVTRRRGFELTQFEYVSVAVSLVLALAIADVLRDLVPAIRAPARYWPHLTWLIAMVLNVVYVWLAIWNLNVRGVSWTGPSLVYILVNPALVTIMASLLTGRGQPPRGSFRALYHENRRPFFTVLLIYSLNGFFTAWVLGSVPVGAISPVQVAALPASALAIAGLCMRSDRAHTILAILALLLISGALAFLPNLASTAPAA